MTTKRQQQAYDSFRHGKGKREPTAGEHRAANLLARQIEKVSLPGMNTTNINEEMPPGRLNVKQAMNLDRQVRTNAPIDATPFRKRRRRTTPKAPLKVGIIGDVSGSMSSLAEPIAVTRWLLAEASHRAHGEVAAVLMGGSTCHPVQAPGERESTIRMFKPYAGYEGYEQAFLMVDSALDLVDSQGPRLLISISDGDIVDCDERAYAKQAIAEFQRTGGVSIWVKPKDATYASTKWIESYGTVITLDDDALQVAGEIGKIAVRELRRNN